jgi:hypothetical protein
MSGIRITGYKEIRDRGNRIIKSLNEKYIDALSQAGEHLDLTSIEFLKSQAKEPGLSVKGGRITEPSSWEIIQEGDNKSILLRCNSEHAAVVEFGGENRAINVAREWGWYAFPVGQQQGNVPTFRPEVKLQQGYHYLSNTMNSPDVQSNMLSKVKLCLRPALATK